MKDASEDDRFGWYQLELNEISSKTFGSPLTTVPHATL